MPPCGVDEFSEMLAVVIQVSEHEEHRKLARAALELDEQLMSFAWRTSPCGVPVPDRAAA